ncbi:hypothetical protein [Brevibacterium permense]|uniref:Uncharacterized protein n=1 Tax=Brevibacterium permense TaxID=234834 RepID=A0ABP4LKW7_9MICO|nr:hypothetical protein [Brevibacterium permense]
MISESDPVIELGKSLANALDNSDIIGRWMAHHIADLITRSEAQPDDQDLARETREVILKLWEHKAGGRFIRTPFEYVQPILAALARLEPDPPPWAHFRTFPARDLPSNDDLSHYPVLEAAGDMDREFGHLVRMAVAFAGRAALEREEPWVVAATEIGGTVVDDVLQRLQKHIRSYRLVKGQFDFPGSAGDLFNSNIDEHAEDTRPSQTADYQSLETEEELLADALKTAISRCSDLLKRLDRLVSMPDAQDVPPTSESDAQLNENSSS